MTATRTHEATMRMRKTCLCTGTLLVLLLAGVLPAQSSDLHEAARTGNVAHMQRLIAEGYGTNEADAQGNLPLHYAAANGHAPIIRLLIDHGVALDATDMRGRTALQIATIAGAIDVMDLLLSHGANVNARAKTGETALHITTLLRKSVLADVLIRHHADLNIMATHTTSRGLDGTPLHWAIQRGDRQMVDRLIAAGADMTLKNSRGLTPSRAAYSHYLRTRNSIYFEISRLLKIRSDQQEQAQPSPPPQP